MSATQLSVIADAGSTKTDWILADAAGNILRECRTGGLNAISASEADMHSAFAEAARLLDAPEAPVFFYGAGCATPDICRRVERALESAGKFAGPFAGSDMLGAARALCGHEAGIACVLGTGSNSCLYDGHDITANIPPLGYLLGDEGSACAMGRRLIADIYKGILPESRRADFEATTGLCLDTIYDGIYRSANPRPTLTRAAEYLVERRTEPDLRTIIRDELLTFLRRNPARYTEATGVPIHFTGSMAFMLADELRESCRALGLTPGRIVRHPARALVKFHTAQL